MKIYQLSSVLVDDVNKEGCSVIAQAWHLDKMHIVVFLANNGASWKELCEYYTESDCTLEQFLQYVKYSNNFIDD